MDTQSELHETLITLTADIVAAHVSNNSVAVSDLPVLIQNVHGALSGQVEPARRLSDGRA
jgi:predicted transcriptional regulator